MDAIWGPALDAEVAYRQERVREASRPRARRSGRSGDDTAEQPVERRVEQADAPAGPVPVGGRVRGHSDEWEGRRGWVLRGSGAWPEAR